MPVALGQQQFIPPNHHHKEEPKIPKKKIKFEVKGILIQWCKFYLQ